MKIGINQKIKLHKIEKIIYTIFDLFYKKITTNLSNIRSIEGMRGGGMNINYRFIRIIKNEFNRESIGYFHIK